VLDKEVVAIEGAVWRAQRMAAEPSGR